MNSWTHKLECRALINRQYSLLHFTHLGSSFQNMLCTLLAHSTHVQNAAFQNEYFLAADSSPALFHTHLLPWNMQSPSSLEHAFYDKRMHRASPLCAGCNCFPRLRIFLERPMSSFSEVLPQTSTAPVFRKLIPLQLFEFRWRFGQAWQPTPFLQKRQGKLLQTVVEQLVHTRPLGFECCKGIVAEPITPTNSSVWPSCPKQGLPRFFSSIRRRLAIPPLPPPSLLPASILSSSGELWSFRRAAEFPRNQ